MAAEFDIITRYFAPLAGPAGLGLLDDAALIQPPKGHELIVTTDALVAGVHFFADDPASTIGHKALAVNLSDLAAKGADPLGFVLSLILPPDIKESWIADFVSGLGQLATSAGCPLIGGDTVVSKGPLTLSITAFGAVPEGQMVRRGTSKAEDILFVTGTIGDGALGLLERSKKQAIKKQASKASIAPANHAEFLIDRYLRPRPRNAIAEVLRENARAAMDISDGFVGDLTKFVSLAGLGADIWLNDVPHSVAARAAFRADSTLIETALTGGDDYEVLAAVPAEKAKSFIAGCLDIGVAVTAVGIVKGKGDAILFLDKKGSVRHFKAPSYVHGLTDGSHPNQT